LDATSSRSARRSQETPWQETDPGKLESALREFLTEEFNSRMGHLRLVAL
jgi:hypothetical protein